MTPNQPKKKKGPIRSIWGFLTLADQRKKMIELEKLAVAEKQCEIRAVKNIEKKKENAIKEEECIKAEVHTKTECVKRDCDLQIEAIHQSTKTTFKRLAPIHNYLRSKNKLYYIWHLNRYSSLVHIGVLLLVVAFTAFSMISFVKVAALAANTKYAGYLYLQETQGVSLADTNDIYYSPIPIPSAIPVTNATATVSGETATTAWQGMFITNYQIQNNDTIHVTANHPLTEAALDKTITVSAGSSAKGAISGYLTKAGDGSLQFSTAPATEANAIFALRVTLDTTEAMPMEDGHFTFNDLDPGTYDLEGWAIYDNLIHHINSSITVAANQSITPLVAETSTEAAPPLSFLWITTHARYGVPTGFYIGTCVVQANGLPPTTASSTPGDPNYFEIYHDGYSDDGSTIGASAINSINCKQTYEQTSVGDVTFTVTYGADTIVGTRQFNQAAIATHVPTLGDLTTSPSPIIIGKLALVRWPSVSFDKAKGASVSFTDMSGNGTIAAYPRFFSTIRSNIEYYPRDYWLMRAEDTAQLTSGTTYNLTAQLADGLDYDTFVQRSKITYTFTAYSEAEAPLANPTISQIDLPLSDTGAFDGYVYFAQPFNPDAPIADTLVISPKPVSYGIPLKNTTLTYDGGSVVADRIGHIHIEGLSPGAKTFSVSSAINPSNGWTFDQNINVGFIARASYSTTDTEGTYIGYLYFNSATSTFGIASGYDSATNTPLYSGRLLVDSPNDATDPSSSNIKIPDSNGLTFISHLSQGSHHIRAEGIKSGTRYIIDKDITIYNGMITTVNESNSTTEAAGEFNVLAAEVYDQSGTDSDSTVRLYGVPASGDYQYNNTTLFAVVGQKECYGNWLALGTFCFHNTQGNNDPADAADLTWWHLVNDYSPGQWNFAAIGRDNQFRIWRSFAQYLDPAGLILETPMYHFTRTTDVEMVPAIKTFPSPLVSGKPGIIYWDADPHAKGYAFRLANSFLGGDIKPLDDPYKDMTRTSTSQVRVLSATETSTWLSNTYQYIPYRLTVYAVDSTYINKESERAFNTFSTTPVNKRVPYFVPAAAQSVTAGNNLSLVINGLDPDWDRITYFASGLPSGASFDTTTHTLSWQPSGGQVGDYTVSFTITDSDNNSATQDVSVHVSAQDVPSPTATATATTEPTASPTATAEPTATTTATEGLTATAASTPTATPADIATATTEPTRTATQTPRSTAKTKRTPTPTPTATATPTSAAAPGTSDASTGSGSGDTSLPGKSLAPISQPETTPTSKTPTAKRVTIGQSVSFEAPEVQEGATYTWDFGDGTSAEGTSVSHTYAAVNLYPVTLKIKDASGTESSTEYTVAEITPPAPKLTRARSKQKKITFEGEALSGNEVAITIHSDPFTTTAEPDASGKFTKTIDFDTTGLSYGEHKISLTTRKVVSENIIIESDPKDYDTSFDLKDPNSIGVNVKIPLSQTSRMYLIAGGIIILGMILVERGIARRRVRNQK